MVGINQTEDVIAAIKALVVQGKLIMADGKLGIDDLKRLSPCFDALKKAKEGATEIPAELKDLDGEEIGQLMMDFADVAMLAYDALVSAPK